MKKLKILKEERSAVIEQIEALNKGAESRSFTADEQKKWDELEAKLEQLDTDIRRAEKVDELEKRQALERLTAETKHNEKKEKNKIAKRYSLLKAIQTSARGGQLDGVELEMQQEAEKEARSSGLSIQGIGLPSFMLETRDMTVGNNPNAGFLVAEELQSPHIPILRPNLAIEKIGSRKMTGLQGNIAFTRQNTASTANWEGEITTDTLTNPTVEKIVATPHRLAATTQISKQLIFQASESAEAFVRTDLENAIAIAVDAAAINGSGAGNIPQGLMGQLLAANLIPAGAPTYADVVKLETMIATLNADFGKLAYLTTPGVRGLLKTTKKDAGSGEFVWGNDQMLNSYRTMISTQVPANLNGADHALLFGNWDDFVLLNWGGVDIVVDPYSKKREAEIEITVNTWWDFFVRHLESFSQMTVTV